MLYTIICLVVSLTILRGLEAAPQAFPFPAINVDDVPNTRSKLKNITKLISSLSTKDPETANTLERLQDVLESEVLLQPPKSLGIYDGDISRNKVKQVIKETCNEDRVSKRQSLWFLIYCRP